ncbi:unnamed protein product [Phytophthora fragariaefolia]|uniref:Unnamed protein product n=1 Tax=Phytophthora fragariaefolia TaxID=1490495 RepID=A0A9W7DA34_9STRA|nr:unnamed protein product [Phytophthora fragariaefolia]
MRGITERLDRLEESQAKLEKTLERDRAKGERKVDPILTPPMDTSLFASGLGRGAPQAQAQQPIPPAQQHPAAAQPGVGQQAFRYPDARQKKLTIRAFNGKELYVGLGSDFLAWGRRFETCPIRLRIPVAGGREGQLPGELPVGHCRTILQQAGRGLVVADADVAVRDGEDGGDLQDGHHACPSGDTVHSTKGSQVHVVVGLLSSLL